MKTAVWLPLALVLLSACAMDPRDRLTGSAGAAPRASNTGPAAQGAAGGDERGAGAERATDGEQALAAGVVIDAIEDVASSSACFERSWNDRGAMPPGFIKGVALVFARAVCSAARSDVVAASQPSTSDGAHDALAWYGAVFEANGMSNDVAGIDTLRHVYTLLLGLGMRESSGRHCCGRDMAASNVSADSAEAGAWQTSWDSRVASAELPRLFARYEADASGCLRDVFAEGVTCDASSWADSGSEGEGRRFQKLQKECPAFAAEYAAVLIRVLGGSQGHYGPLRTRAAEVRPECDAMLGQVQALVQQTPSVCGAL